MKNREAAVTKARTQAYSRESRKRLKAWAELARNRREAKRQEAERFLAARNEEGKTNDAHK